jgi:phage-related protein (TIGR01555 family)
MANRFAEESMLGTELSLGTALDILRNPAARFGLGTPSIPEATEYVLTRLTFNYWLLITLYETHWLHRRIIDAPIQDMVRAWPHIDSDLAPDDLKDFDRTLQRTGTQATITLTMKWAQLFGGAGALMVIDGHEKALDEPLDLRKVNPGSYQGLIPFDRWAGIYPVDGTTQDFAYPRNFNLPEYYSIMSQGKDEGAKGQMRVHHSRILRFTGPQVPQPEFQAYSRWGISKLALTYEEVRKRDNMSSAILNLMFRASILAQKNKQLASLLSGLGTSSEAAAQFYRIQEAQNQLLSNQSMLIIPEEGGLESHQYTFGGIADVYQQFQLDVSGCAEIPVPILWGRTLSGLAQSNDADMRIYEQKIAQRRMDELNPVLEQQLYPVIMMSEFGDVPKDFSLKYPPLRVLTEEEKADLAGKMATAISTYYNAGIFTQQMALKEVKETSEQTGIGTNVQDEDIEKASNEFLPAPGEMDLADEMGGEEPKASEGKAKDSVPLVIQGFPVEIESRMGEERYGGKLPAHYGYIVGAPSAEGNDEAMDAFINPQGSDKIFLIDGYIGKDFDEHKVMFGYDDARSALRDFTDYYSHLDGRTGKVRRVEAKDLRTWLKSGDVTQPYAYVQ